MKRIPRSWIEPLSLDKPEMSPPDFSSLPEGKPELFFEGSEHTNLGNSATLYFGTGQPEAAGATKLHITDTLALTYGQIVALGGDFFGDYQYPISDGTTAQERARRFSAAFATMPYLYPLPPYSYQANLVLGIMAKEFDLVAKAIAAGKQPSTGFEGLSDTAEYERVTVGRYLLLSAWNWDHFGQRALLSYQTGHGAALAQALVARTITEPLKRRRALELAYALDAFSNHFLSDLFSAGHLRTPRRELTDRVTIPGLGSLLAWWMHDEDSKWGLACQNRDGQRWKSYGDKRLADTMNLKNRILAESAVQSSIDEVFIAFDRGTVPQPQEYLALAVMADLTEAQKPDNRLHHSPMFVWDGREVLRRNHLNDLNDYSWTANWNAYDTWQELRNSYRPTPPAGFLPAPTGRPAFDPQGWRSTTPVPPNWVAGKRLRYAVSFFRDHEESDLGPWSDQVTLKDRFFPTLIGIPVDASGRAKGRRIWRQLDSAQFELVGEIPDNTATIFIDKKA
jgi:hypothetical protein